MSEFAQLDANDQVVQVILADQAFIDSGLVGPPAAWLPVVPHGSAGIGYVYDAGLGAFTPPVLFSASKAKAELIAMIDATTSPILRAYPEAEPLAWPAKEAEAVAFIAAPEPVPADYALLRGEVAAELAIAAGVVTIEQLAAKVEAVLWMASQWRALISTLSGLRARTLAAIDAAADDAGRRAVLDEAGAELADLVPTT